MKTLKILFCIVLSLVCLFFIIGSFLPNQWEISKSRIIQASPEKIYPQVAILRNWQRWSPWENEALKMTSTYSGPELGVGAQWNWTSEDMGSGWLRITESNQDTGIKYQLFIDMNGSQSELSGQIAFEPEGENTRIIWTDRGTANGIFERWKAFMIGFMIKGQMTKGLDKLATVL